MKWLSVVIACLVCVGLSIAGGTAMAGDMNQGGNGASSTSGNSSGGGY